MTKDVQLNATIDEITFAAAYPDKTGAGVSFGMIIKLTISKGEQTELVCDSHRIQPIAYYNRHKIHVKPDSWIATRMVEARQHYKNFTLWLKYLIPIKANLQTKTSHDNGQLFL